MPQTLLPIFPAEATPINELISFCQRDGAVYYFHGCVPVFTHAEKDLKSFRMYTSQLVVNVTCTQAELVRAFGISGKLSAKKQTRTCAGWTCPNRSGLCRWRPHASNFWTPSK
jgi:hypothetical protein